MGWAVAPFLASTADSVAGAGGTTTGWTFVGTSNGSDLMGGTGAMDGTVGIISNALLVGIGGNGAGNSGSVPNAPIAPICAIPGIMNGFSIGMAKGLEAAAAATAAAALDVAVLDVNDAALDAAVHDFGGARAAAAAAARLNAG